MNEKFKKGKIFKRIAMVSDDNDFDIERHLYKAGIYVKHLPPYHPKMNPIELVWVTVIGKVALKTKKV